MKDESVCEGKSQIFTNVVSETQSEVGIYELLLHPERKLNPGAGRKRTEPCHYTTRELG